jgi:hypothetical protein
LLLGAGLGPALFLAIDRLQLSGELLLSFAIGAFLTLGICLVVVGIATLFIVPRIFTNARGTLAGMVNDMTLASRAHAEGDTDRAIDHFGKAVAEGASWYSIGATRRFIAQAAVGLLISFGGLIGAALLFSQNALLKDQNTLLNEQNNKIEKQLALLIDQNTKVDKQLELLTAQNAKIDQQTGVADAQKRNAFVTEMFSILSEVAKADRAAGEIPKELSARIAVLTSSAVPYIYLDFFGDHAGSAPRRIPRALSPERGQLVVALARMKVKLRPLVEAGANFEYSDLRGADLTGADLSGIMMDGSDLSSAKLILARLVNTGLRKAIIKDVNANSAKFNNALFSDGDVIENTDCSFATFDGSQLVGVTIKGGNLAYSSFVSLERGGLSLENVELRRAAALPKGLPRPQEMQDSFNASKEVGTAINLKPFILSYTFPKTRPTPRDPPLPQ